MVNAATGVIGSLQLCTFEKSTCGGFQAGASQGFLWVNLTNTGSLNSDFTLTVRLVFAWHFHAFEWGFAWARALAYVLAYSEGHPTTLTSHPPRVSLGLSLGRISNSCMGLLHELLHGMLHGMLHELLV